MPNAAKTISFFLLSAALLSAYPSGSRIPAGNAGEPGSGTPCASCHTVTLNPPAGNVRITLPGGNQFTAGTPQRWTITVTDSNSSHHKGFQLTATAGTFAAVTSTVVTTASTGRQYVAHSSASAPTYAFDWTPPTSGDSVTLYVAGAAASGTRQTNVYTTSITLTRATTAAKPAINSGGVVNAASFAAGISSGSWVTIFGNDLAPSGVNRAWLASEIVDGKLPTALEGTQVRINGKPAAIAYISPGQLNVQAPEDAATGAVSVEVITAGGTSQAASADLRKASPGIFRYSPSAARYAAAVHLDGTAAAPAGLFEGAKPARPGETVLLFGTGFGATEPAVAAGTVPSGPAPLASGNGLALRIGGVAAEVTFAGISAAGLYQFNAVVPKLPDGEYPVEASVWGQDVPTRQYLAIKQ